jgi:hypothetical protein
MWSAIKKAASSIINVIKPKAAPAVKPGIVTTFTNPNLGQLGPTYNPQTTGNPQKTAFSPQATANPQRGATNPQGQVLKVSPVSSGAANALAIQQAAIRQAAADQARKVAATNALNKQKSSILTALKDRASKVKFQPVKNAQQAYINFMNSRNGAVKDPRRLKLTEAQKKALTPQHPNDPITPGIDAAGRNFMHQQEASQDSLFNSTVSNYRRNPLSVLGWAPSNTAKPQVQQKHNGFLDRVRSVVGAPKKAVDGAFNLYYAEKDKNAEKKRINQDQQLYVTQAEARRKALDAKTAELKKSLARGDISSDQAYGAYNVERSKFLNWVNLANNDLESRSKAVAAPHQGKTVDFLRKASTVLDPLGKVAGASWKALQYGVEAPKRITNTAINLAKPNRGIENWNTIDTSKAAPKWGDFVKAHGGKTDQATLQQYNKTLSVWKNQQDAELKRVNYSGNPLDRFKQAWAASKDQLLVGQRGTLATQNKRLAKGVDIGLDPINFAPNSWGGKVAGVAGKFLKPAAEAVGATRVGKGFIGAGKTIADSKIGQAAQWLNKPIVKGDSKYMAKYLEQSKAKFAALSDADHLAYQDIMKAGGKVPKGYSWMPGTNKKAVVELAGNQRKLYSKLYSDETKGGLNYRPSKGYFPTKRELKDQAAFMGLQEHAAPFFTRSKKADSVFNGEELAFADAYRQFASDKALKRLPNQRFVSGNTDKLRHMAGAPTRAWKSAVLRYNPAWYINNVGWNIPASFMTGGVRTAKGYGQIAKAALKERTLNPSMLDELPDDVVSKGFQQAEFGNKGKLLLGSKIENLSRAAGYLGARGQGLGEKEAVKKLNRYMFDYSDVKNWERPLMSVLPFWRWQKNITRMTATLPFTSPRFASGFNQIKKTFMDRPMAQLPDVQTTTKDPETGETKTFNPRDQYKGKIHIPGKGWINTPFLPILPDNLARVGVHPAISLLKRLSTGKDYFGNNRNGEGMADFFGSAFPQYDAAKNGFYSVAGKGERKEVWMSASGYGKEAQGYDPTKPNYKKDLDPTAKMWSGIGRLFGANTFKPKEFDEQKFRDNLRYKQFSDAYFNRDWNKEFPDLTTRTAEQTKLAKTFGYDLQKDMFDGRWSKYDNAETTRLKERRKATIAIEKNWYDLYNALPKNNGSRSNFIKEKKYEMAESDILDRYPELDFMSKVNIKSDEFKDGNKKGSYTSKGSKKSSVSSNSTGTSSEWARYYSLDKAGRAAMRAAKPSMFKYGAKKPENERAAKIAWAKKNLPPDVYRAYIRKNGLTDPEKANWTDAQWQTYLKDRGLDNDSKYARDLVRSPELGEAQIANIREIISSYKKPLPLNTKGLTWALPKRKTRKQLTFKA